MAVTGDSPEKQHGGIIGFCHGAADQAWSSAAVAAVVVFQTDRRRAAPFYVAGPCQAPDKRSYNPHTFPDAPRCLIARHEVHAASHPLELVAAIIGRAST